MRKKHQKKESSKFLNLTTYKAFKKFASSKNELSYLALFVLIATGARFGEIQKLQYKDINKKDCTIHLPCTKTESADRTNTITDKDMKHIVSILKSRPISFNGYIFNTGANLISNKAVTDTMRKFLLENGLGNFTLHALRHTHASMLLANGFSIQLCK